MHEETTDREEAVAAVRATSKEQAEALGELLMERVMGADVMKDDTPSTTIFPQVESGVENDEGDELRIEKIARKASLEALEDVLEAVDDSTEQVDPNRYTPGDYEALRDMLFPKGWDQEFTSRQWGLIKNCRTYAENEPSGLPGHQLMLIVAIMADQFDMVLSIASKLSEDLSGTFTENRIYGERLTKIDADRRDDLKLIADLETRNQRLRMELETLHGNHLKDMGRIEELEGQVEVAYEANMGADL